MVNPEDIKKLEDQIMKVNKSTRTTIPALTPTHDWLRRKFPWYYRWHTNNVAVGVHVLIIVAILVLLAYLFLRATADIQF